MITLTYAAILAGLFLVLSIRTIRLRRASGEAVGSSGSGPLAKAVRAHANFAEYVPLSLVLIYFLEVLGAGSLWLHLLGGLLVAGRACHAWGISQVEEDYRYRVTGMVLTFTVIGAAAVAMPFAAHFA